MGIRRASAAHASLRFGAGLALAVGDHCPGHSRALRSGARLPARAYLSCEPCFCTAFLRRIAQNSAVASSPQRSSIPAPSCTPGRLRTSHWPCLCSASLSRCLPTLLCTRADSAESCVSPALGVLTTPCSLDCAGALWESDAPPRSMRARALSRAAHMLAANAEMGAGHTLDEGACTRYRQPSSAISADDSRPRTWSWCSLRLAHGASATLSVVSPP